MIFRVLHSELLKERDDLKKFADFFPAVHKLASGGYDGRGVQILGRAARIFIWVLISPLFWKKK